MSRKLALAEVTKLCTSRAPKEAYVKRMELSYYPSLFFAQIMQQQIVQQAINIKRKKKRLGFKCGSVLKAGRTIK